MHAISVGEVAACASLVDRLREACPFAAVHVSVGTLAGREVAGKLLRGRVQGVFYAPLDYCFCIRRVLRLLRPSVVAVLETEIWPNLWREARRSGAKLILLNGRISDRAFPKYRRFRWFFQPVLSLPDRILVQSEIYRQRFLALGTPHGSMEVAGNLKYDFPIEEAVCPAPVSELVARLRPERIWVAASTMPRAEPDDPDEDAVVLEAFSQLAASRPGLLLLLAPRKPDRFDAAEQELRRRGIDFVRRTALATGPQLRLPGVVLVDTLGELAGLFRIADVVFLGGSLARRGGHNVLEPAFFGKPVIVGPNMQNFPDIAAEFRAEAGFHQIASASELAGAVDLLLSDEELAGRIGDRGRMLAERRRGVSAAVSRVLTDLLDDAIVVDVPSLAARMTLGPLSRLWHWGVRIHRFRAAGSRRRLGSPVISIGGLVMGGVGKTPLVRMLAEQVRARSLTPAILTRGYRRRSAEAVILDPRQSAPVGVTGDEAQMFVLDGFAAVGIGADRHATGTELAKKLRPDVFLLDDGFQHWPLDRDVNIVALDSLDPIGGGQIFPLGRLREPEEAMRRAHAVVITRCRPEREYRGIRRLVAKHSPSATVHKALLRPIHWVGLPEGNQRALPELEGRMLAAFCGLADPASFRRTLDSLAVEISGWRVFRDHHRYSLRDIAGLTAMARRSGASVLVTTEKDGMNLPDGYEKALEGLELFFLRIRMELENPEELGKWFDLAFGIKSADHRLLI